MQRRTWTLVALVVMALSLGGCGSDDDSAGSENSGAWDREGGDRDGHGGPEDGKEPGTGDPGTAPDGGDGSEVGGQGGSGGQQQAGQLTAGEWRDLDHWDLWRELVEGTWAAREAAWGFDTSARFPVTVVDDEGAAVRDADVQLLDAQGLVLWRARTDVWGEAELFGDLFGGSSQGPFSVRASSGRAVDVKEGLEAAPAGRIDIELNGATAPAPVLDVAFLVDTTGSMSDELRYLQTELDDVIQRVRTRQAQMTIRVGLGFYRDTGDAYVVRDFPFTEEIDEALANLAAQSTAGGGDYEEALEEGLEALITQGQWSDSARARLLFVVLDAPPHHRAPVVAKIQEVTSRAAELGIRIVPIAASGVDKNTEFLLRLLGISTGGTYTFLTDHSGIGNPHIEPTVGEYQVEFLNDLLVRVIGEALGE